MAGGRAPLRTFGRTGYVPPARRPGRLTEVNRKKDQRSGGADQAKVSLGEAFREYRTEILISQEALAERAGVDARTVRNFERDISRQPASRDDLLQALNELRLQRGFPAVRLAKEGRRMVLGTQPASWLELPDRQWLSRVHGPGALLTADYRVVPFHGGASLKERDDLREWCLGGDRHGIRIYKGEGGIGKTRLALELCRLLMEVPGRRWVAGFVQPGRLNLAESPWDQMLDLFGPVLVVVDYAGDPAKAGVIAHLLLHLTACPAPRVRLLFLERNDYWVDRLHEDRAVREILLGPLLSRRGHSEVHSLPPVATSMPERQESLRMAVRAFSAKLRVQPPPTPADSFSDDLYQSVLFIHMRALLAVLGKNASTRDAILRHLLAREREYWRKRLDAVGLDAALLPAVKAAVHEIGIADDVKDLDAGTRLLQQLPLLQGQTPVVIRQLCAMLRECYPAAGGGIGRLQPDMLRHYLAARFV